MAKVRVLLTVDMHSADSTKRSDFDTEMADRKWKKRLSTTTTWTASFQEDVDAASAVRTTKSDVSDAAKAAKISSWDAICLPSTESPVEF